MISKNSIIFYPVNILKRQVARCPALANSRLNIRVATVDGFQGSECDVIILSCVRSRSKGIGFCKNDYCFLSCYVKHYVPLTHSLNTTFAAVNDERRVNVAITRAKTGLWIVGDVATLKVDALWKKLIGHMQTNRAFRQSSNFDNLR